MRIEFHTDDRTGATVAGHASNGAILAMSWNEHLALAAVIESVEKAVHEINNHEPLNEAEQRVVDQLFDAAETLRTEGNAREREEHPDPENVYDSASIRQSIEEERK